MADLRLLFLNCLKVCSKTCSKPTEICYLCYLEEIPEVLLKPDSVTDFKNIFQSTYQDTQLTLTETILLSFLSPTLNMVSFAEALSEATTHKNNSTKTFGIFQVKIWQSSFVENSCQQYSVRKTWNFTKKGAINDLTLLVQYIKACADIIIKTSKYWLLHCQLWKYFCRLK